jgi:ribulose-phosphate 3-epimerase
MVSEPEKWIEPFSQAGTQSLTIHAESSPNWEMHLRKIQALGMKAGVSLKPHTPIESIEGVLSWVDLVLIMSVEPGFGGQSFMPQVLSKLRWLTGRTSAVLQIDGGIDPSTLPLAYEAGARNFVAGSAVFKDGKIGQNLKKLFESLRVCEEGV